MNNNDLNHLKRIFLKEEKIIILSVTKRCNLCCVYCRKDANSWYDNLSKNSDSLDLPKSKWDELVEVCRKNNIADILLTGGEPFEYPLIKEFCLFLKDNNIKFSIHTNGVSPKAEDVLDFLLENKINPNIYISTEVFPEHQKLLRNSPLAYKIIEKAVSGGLLVELKVVLNSLLLEKEKEILPALKSWVDKGITSIKFQPIVPVTDNAMINKLALDKNFIPLVEMLMNAQLNDETLKKVFRNTMQSHQALINYLSGFTPQGECFYKCEAFNKIIFITPDFNFLNCKSLWNKDENVSCDKLFDLVCCGFL